MTLRYFDVVVLGMRTAALACAALLARRDFRVLVVGDSYLPSTYRFASLPLRRRPFVHLAAQTPAYRRVLAELAQSQAFRRRLRPLDPMYQVLDRELRLDIPPEPAVFARELDRAFPNARGPIEDMYATLARIESAVDQVLERDAVWPPGTFWERRETAKLRDLLPDAPESWAVDPDYRRVMEIAARFSSHVASDILEPLAPLSLARLHSAWTRGPLELPGDEDEFSAMLIERIRAHGGEVRENEHCEAILHKRNRVRAVILDSDGEETGCGFVISDRPAGRMLDRVRDAAVDDPPHEASLVARRRFVVSMIVSREVVPAPLARHVFLRPLREGGLDVHLHRATFTRPDPALTERDAELWVCEALLDDAWMPHTSNDLRAREGVLATVRDHFAFIDQHLLVIDSPHDGAPLFARAPGETALRAHPRSSFRATGGSIHAEPTEVQFRRYPDAYAEIAGEPIRSPIDHLLIVAPSVIPALGAEGELIAAWGAARLVTRTDRKREKLRREMWSKIEI